LKRFESYGWHVQSVKDGNDLEAITKAIQNAKEITDKPSLIQVRTHIAYGSPNKQDSASSHGSPLGEDEVRLTKEFYGWDPDKHFYVPDKVYDYYKYAVDWGKKTESEWNELFSKYKEQYPDLIKEYESASKGEINIDWKKVLPVFELEEKGVETRKASGKVINAIAPYLPNMIGGSADLSPSTDTAFKD